MTLKNISLPPIVLANLYKYSLVENDKKKAIQDAHTKFLGGNNKHILFLVNNPDTVFIPNVELTFLSEILTACKLSMNDIAIVNLDKSAPSKFANIPENLQARIVILCAIELSVLELPFKVPLLQVQQYKDKKYVTIPSLQAIQNDKALKRKLWELLRVLFSI